ncbi:type I restriction endonuclease subunit R [Bacillus velezensis]|uniref:type I restriction endonuclease subunit R n=1 Tax=Bacillus velezensis TaxID=492670 RepID=UPI0021763327|nr:type I restriction endonuclease subunit R [Bacillus velezensis]
MYNFLEDELEEAALEWFRELDYEIAYGPLISPNGDYPERTDYTEVILEQRLREALTKINKDIPSDAIEDAIRKIMIPNSPSLFINNRTFHRYITDGIDVDYRDLDGNIKYDKVWLFDFYDETNNDFLAVNQLTIIENEESRTDIIAFVNGIPLSVIELKSSSDENVGITKAFNQIQNYQNQVPSLFVYNAFSVISDGFNARVGTLTANEERFMMWRTIDGDEIAPVSVPQLETLIKGLFDKKRLLDIIQRYIVFNNSGSESVKIIAGYHQYHASKKALINTQRSITKNGDRKIGVIYFTQGSGKSLLMVFYAGEIINELDNPTLVVVTDRNDLDDQLFSTFAKSKELIRQSPQNAKNRKHLRELLSVQSGGVIFTTIQKFAVEDGEEDHPILTDRNNVIIMTDESHRSQYGFNAEVVEEEDGAKVKYGYAKHMRDALPNASFIAFTGTPIELVDRNTPAVFGDYIDIYDMNQAVEDETTVKIFYESRIANIQFTNEQKNILDTEYEEITETEEEDEKRKLKSKWSSLEALVGTETRLKRIAKDIVEHYEKRQEVTFGKSMIVVMSRRIAIEMYKHIIDLRPDWHDDDDNKGIIKIVMSGSSSDKAEWQPYISDKGKRELYARRMKDENDPLRIVIVRDMWLTGFDVPSINTMYIDKPMKGHNLMQAIARVNRVYKDKPGGLIVDYIGFADSLRDALSQYTDNSRRTTGIDTQQAVNLMLEKYDLICEILDQHDYSKFNNGSPADRIKAIVETVEFILSKDEKVKKDFTRLVTELSKAYALCATQPEAEALNFKIGFFKAVKAGIVKMIPTDSKKKSKSQLDAEMNQLISKSVISEEVVDILNAIGLSNDNISIFSEEFLKEIKSLEYKNIAVELLKRLLNGKLRVLERKNYVKSRKFSDMLQKSIEKYTDRREDTQQTIMDLINLAKDMNSETERKSENGLKQSEIAFFDAITANPRIVEKLNLDTLKTISIQISKEISSNMKVDWYLRESMIARMRVTIKRILKKNAFPIEEDENVVDTIVKQAILMTKENI